MQPMFGESLNHRGSQVPNAECSDISRKESDGIMTEIKSCSRRSTRYARKNCILCGKEFEPSGSYAKYCGECAKAPPKRMLPHICVMCGNSYQPEVRTRKACSDCAASGDGTEYRRTAER